MNTKNSQLRQSNLKQLLDEFKFHLIYRNKHTKVTSPINDEFKDVLAQLREGNRVKRGKIRAIKESSMQIQRKSYISIRPSTSLQSRIWQPNPIDENALGDIKQNLIVVERERDSLKVEISNLQSSLVDLKKKVAEMRKRVELESSKIEKYKHISYLSNSIQRNTDTVKILNNRSYKQMLQHQQQTLNNLKRFKTTLRKENQELQSKYTQNQQNNKTTVIRKTVIPEKSEQSEVKSMKIDKKFISSLEELIQLFMEKQKEFEEIKVQQTTKIRLKKAQMQYLKEDRVRWHEMIEKFEQKYEVKIESLPNLIVFIYKRLVKDCIEMENECIKKNDIRQLLEEDMHDLNKKASSFDSYGNEHSLIQDHYNQMKRERIFINSQNLLKIAMIFHCLVGKFKYLFTMAITLSKEKKHFHDLLLQIGNIYNPNHLLLDCIVSEASNFDKAVANFKEMQDILTQVQYEESSSLKQELLSFIFTDLRFALVFRKEQLEEQLKEGLQKGCIFQKIKAIQNRCDDIYFSKIKIYSHLLINCLKALSMNKYEKKMVASSKAKEALFMPIRKTIKIINFEENQSGESSSEKQFKSNQEKFNSEQSQVEPQHFEFTGDPRRIVQILQQVKNEERRKFKPLNLNSDQVYMYDRKVVLPKYIL